MKLRKVIIMEKNNIHATENLKDLLSDSFAVDNTMKKRIKVETMHAFRDEFNKQKEIGLGSLITRFLTGGTVIAFAVTLAVVNPFYAAKASYSVGDSSQATTVKVYRGENGVTTDKNIKIGDEIEVSGRGKTYIQAEKASFSAVAPTLLVIQSQDTVKLNQGSLEEIKAEGLFILQSEEGRVEANQATFSVEVTKGGETRVQVKEGSVNVFNKNNERLAVLAGNEIKLRGDTQFKEKEVQQVKMTTNDLKGIEKKLDIVRTRTLSALIAYSEGNKEDGERNLVAAKNSFINLYEFFSYDDVIKPLEGSVELKDVLKKIEGHTSNAYLVDQANAIAKLIELSERFNKILKVELPEESKSFNRYLILEELFKLDRNEQNDFYKERLQTHYIELYVSSVELQKTYIGKEAYIKETLQKLPENEIADAFKKEVYERLSSDLQKVMEDMYKLEE